MGLLDDLEFLKKRKPNLLADVRQLQRPSEPYLRQQYPEVYGGLGGLLGMAPDEMAGSVLDPNTARVRSGAEYGFPVGTAAQVAPLARPAQAAAMAAGRAGERFAERAVPRIMERGGMGAEMLQGMGRGTVSPLDVYHGSPYKFDRFDASKIGSGEGAQVYGHGLYFAEAPEVAKGYQATLGHKGALDLEHEAIQRGIPLSREAQIELMRQSMRDMPPKIAVKNLQNANIETRNLDPEKLAALVGDYKASKQGSLYKVDLPDEQIAKMLDWDKPLSEQSDAVKAALKGIETKFPEIPDFNLRKWMDTDPLASTFHNVINRDLGVDPSLIANVFKEQGIPGIKYLDEGSRQPGVASMTQAQLDTRINILKKDIDSGLGNQDRMKQILSSLEAERASHPKLTRNFVTFPGEEQSMTILERNGQPMIARTQQQDATPDLLQYQQMLDEEERRKSAGLLFR